MRIGSFEERFWARVNKRGQIVRKSLGHCWEFQAPPLPNGYIHIKKGGKQVLVHRESWIMANGPIHDGLLVCHKCDNKPCIRPTHLFLGTSKDNAQDMLKKGRANKAKGAAHGLSKLTEKEVLHLLKKFSTGNYTKRQLASEFGIGDMQVGRIIRGERWSHLQG